MEEVTLFNGIAEAIQFNPNERPSQDLEVIRYPIDPINPFEAAIMDLEIIVLEPAAGHHLQPRDEDVRYPIDPLKPHFATSAEAVEIVMSEGLWGLPKVPVFTDAGLVIA